jgi:hypothetical protein
MNKEIIRRVSSNNALITILLEHGIVIPIVKIHNYGIFYEQTRSLNVRRDKKILDELADAGVDIRVVDKHGVAMTGIIMNGIFSGRNHPFVLTPENEFLTCSNARGFDPRKKMLNADLCTREFQIRNCRPETMDKTCNYVNNFYLTSFKTPPRSTGRRSVRFGKKHSRRRRSRRSRR